MVELALAEIEPAHQCADGAGARLHRHEGAFHLGLLGQRPVALGAAHRPHHRPAADLLLRLGVVGQAAGHRFQAFTGDGDAFARLQHRHHLLGRGFQHHGGLQLVVVGVVGQGLGNAGVQRGGIGLGRQVDAVFRPAVVLAALVVQQAAAQGPVGHGLVGGVHRHRHIQAAGGGLGAVLAVHQLAHRLGHVLGMHHRVGGCAQLQHLGAGGDGLLLGDEAVALHAVDDVLLPARGALGVADRVVGAGRLRQAGQHGGLGHGQVGQRLAEVDVGRRRKAVGPLPQEDLVHVDLQDLRLAQLPLDLECQQDLVDLAGEGLLGAQVEVARHLHGDGRRALALGLVELRQRGARHAQVVDPAVAVEAGVLDGQHRLLHHLGDLGDGRVDAALFAKFTQQHAVG